jgi:hypothetical protein
MFPFINEILKKYTPDGFSEILISTKLVFG